MIIKNTPFYLLFILTLSSVFFTHPFMVYPFDVYTHLDWIHIQNTTESSPIRQTWHSIWSSIFHFLDIGNTEILLRASIIHYTQSIIIFVLLFTSSLLIIKNVFKNLEKQMLYILAYWVTILWFSILSTSSVGYHQVWIIWYSVNYQITLPLTLLLLAIIVSLIFESMSLKKRIIYILLSITLSLLVLALHAMEYIYFLLYISVLFIIHLDKIWYFSKKRPSLSFSLFIAIGLAFSFLIITVKSYSYRTSPLLEYLNYEKFPLLFTEISTRGERVLAHYNKASSTINELMILSLCIIIIFFLIMLYRNYKHYPKLLNQRLMLFIFMASLFIFIPLNKYTAGLASLITYDTVSYRFYYSTLLYLILPLFIYYILAIYKIQKILFLNIIIIVVLLSTLFYSKTFSTHQNYYKNIRSIYHIFQKEKMQFNLNSKEIQKIGEILKNDMLNQKTSKPYYYYARDDISFVIKFIYRKPVFYHAKGSKNYQKSYEQDKEITHQAILFQTPKSFPSYKRFIQRNTIK
ncbi:hypothetical protein MNB_SV-13-1738 [hydrothermal vent metagenome]|uniref:Uncharacterized protein n=1 Tax=hydrothermal vent metagenome TaxID=652676 RepID=A0A1W1CB89_9ZZZZ